MAGRNERHSLPYLKTKGMQNGHWVTQLATAGCGFGTKTRLALIGLGTGHSWDEWMEMSPNFTRPRINHPHCPYRQHLLYHWAPVFPASHLWISVTLIFNLENALLSGFSSHTRPKGRADGLKCLFAGCSFGLFIQQRHDRLCTVCAGD